jgi:hypothetical protein
MIAVCGIIASGAIMVAWNKGGHDNHNPNRTNHEPTFVMPAKAGIH